MTKEEHKKRHLELHKAMDELFADAISHGSLGTGKPILELIKWSFKQTVEPDHKP